MENNPKRLKAPEVFESCEKLWRDSGARQEIDRLFEEEYRSFHRKVAVLDDDPTGIQTVHDVDVYTDWEPDSLEAGMRSEDPMFFVLTNSRSFSAEETERVHRQIALGLVEAAERTGREFVLISRGDSTLRGHFPLETKVLRETLRQKTGAVFSGEVLCPFFAEGGRFTVNGVHYVKDGETLIPAAETEFAKDPTFGYTRSDLPGYIAEKYAALKGRQLPAGEVVSVTLKDLRSLELKALEDRLYGIEGFCYIAADALEEADVKALAIVLMRLMRRGREYIFRSAAAVPKVLGGVSSRPLLSRRELIPQETAGGGMVIAGSHTGKTTGQLRALGQSQVPLEWIEFHAGAWQMPGGLEAEAERASRLAQCALERGATAVVYTSRDVIAPPGAGPEELLAISVGISDALTSVVSRLRHAPRFLIAKGGITSSDVGTRGLSVKRARVAGQVRPGIPVWRTGPESRFPGLPYIIFPGNVGEENTLREIVEMLS